MTPRTELTRDAVRTVAGLVFVALAACLVMPAGKVIGSIILAFAP